MADEQLTEQEIFDTVARHLLIQGKQARVKLNPLSTDGSAITRCTYGTWAGPKCAIGCLFTEAEFAPGEIVEVFENLGTWVKVAKDVPNMIPERLRNHEDFLDELQQIHDHTNPDEWRHKLYKFASYYGLKITALEEFNNADS